MKQVSPRPPIILDENGDILMYASVEDACHKLEAIDVLDGAYMLFDSEGFRLDAEVSGYDVVGMSVVSDEPQRDDLALRLRRFVVAVGPDRIGLPDAESAPLDRLIPAVFSFFCN